MEKQDLWLKSAFKDRFGGRLLDEELNIIPRMSLRGFKFADFDMKFAPLANAS